MYFPPKPFDLAEALQAATLVDTAYDMTAQWEAQGKPHADAFKWTPKGSDEELRYSAPIWGSSTLLVVFKHPEPFAYVASRGDTGYVVFRGTSTPDDGIEDLRAAQEDTSFSGFGRAHEGFWDVYRTLSPSLLEAVKALPSSVERLFVFGHSMGSAFSTLAVVDLLLNTRFTASQLVHYNLASPRVASSEFADRYEATGVPTYRVVNTCDLVPEVPPAVFGKDLYRHVGIPVCFSKQNGSIVGNHSCANTYLRALQDSRTT